MRKQHARAVLSAIISINDAEATRTMKDALENVRDELEAAEQVNLVPTRRVPRFNLTGRFVRNHADFCPRGCSDADREAFRDMLKEETNHAYERRVHELLPSIRRSSSPVHMLPQ